MGKKVEEFENLMTQKYGIKALAFSSGSTANQAIFEIYKQRNPEKFKNSLVICPVVTWISSISPAVMAGYEIKFCDVNLDDFCFDYQKLEKILEENKNRNLIIWPTALIGHSPNFDKLKQLSKKYNAELFLDSCENQFSEYENESILSQCDMTSLSCFWSHHMVSIEFGFVFFKKESDYLFAKMFRNHGLVRSLSKDHPLRIKIQSDNPTLDPEFLFSNLGTNLRPTDCHAIWGLQDIKRADKYKKHRKDIYEYFYRNIEYRNKYYLPNYDEVKQIKQEHVGFCLPVFRRDNLMWLVKEILNENGIFTRPLIGSCLTLQPPFQKYHNEKEFPNGLWIHNHGCYIGLHNKVTKSDIDDLMNILDLI